MMPTSGSPQLDILTFRLGDGWFGIIAETVQEIVSAVAILPLPSAPAVVLGVINLRGEVVAVLDTRLRFGLSPQPLHLSEHFVVCQYDTRRVALRVDHVEGFVSCERAAVQPMDQIAARTPHIAGVVPLADGMLLIHDLPTFLSDAETWRLDAALKEWKSANPHE